jgi:hypothetical protein
MTLRFSVVSYGRQLINSQTLEIVQEASLTPAPVDPFVLQSRLPSPRQSDTPREGLPGVYEHSRLEGLTGVLETSYDGGDYRKDGRAPGYCG